jgi:hypothetical protein
MNQPPPSANAKNSDALGNAVERERKNAWIMPLGSLFAGKTSFIFENLRTNGEALLK